MEFKQSTPDIIAFHGVSCQRGTHYVRVLISKPSGLFSNIHRIEEYEELTFEQFRKRDFSSTDMHKEIVGKMKEFDKGCCKPVHERIKVRTLGHPSSDAESDFIQFVTKTLVHRLLSCFPWTPFPEQSRSSRRLSRQDMILKSPSQSIETLTANNRRSQHTDDLTLIASRSSRLDTKSPSQSTETLTANDKRSQDVDDPASTVS
jgi:hypothetical protein